MRRLLGLLVLVVGSAVSVAGCATTHVQGEFRPDAKSDITKKTDMQTLADGSNWPLFWGLVELGSNNVNDELSSHLHENEVITDMEVRQHLSLPGALLWIISAGIVSHHDIDVRGRIAQVKEKKVEEPKPTTAMGDRTTIIVPIAPLPAGFARVDDDYGDRDAYAEATIDRPLSEIAKNFNDAATRAGLIPVGDIEWSRYAAGRTEMRSETPRLEAAAKDVRTFHVIDEKIASKVETDPERGLFVPGVVAYDAGGGQTKVLYGKPVTMLRRLKEHGLMSAEKADAHMEHARIFEANLEKLVENLRGTKGS
jgi:hypothetical protein